MPPVVHVQQSRGEKDCAIVALSIYLERSYEDVLSAAVTVTKAAAPHNRGVWMRELRQIASKLGSALSLRRKFDLDTDEGLVWFSVSDRGDEHVAYCKGGLVFGMSCDVWEHELYCITKGYRPTWMLVKVTE